MEKFRSGSTILEALVAIGLLALYFVALTGLLMGATQSTQSSFTREHMRLSAQEATAALRAASFSELVLLAEAILAYNENTDRWAISAGGPEQVSDALTRSVSIEPVFRDEDCRVVTVGGTEDPDSRYLITTMSRETVGGDIQTAVTQALRVNWQDPQGDCFKPTQASFVRIDVSAANWGGSKQLRDVVVRNPTPQDATVTKITMTWTHATSQIQQIFFEEGKVWSDTGPGTPTGTQPSGTEIDIEDVTIVAGEDGEAYKVQFTKAMSGITLTITLEFADGSVLSTDPFTPSN